MTDEATLKAQAAALDEAEAERDRWREDAERLAEALDGLEHPVHEDDPCYSDCNPPMHDPECVAAARALAAHRGWRVMGDGMLTDANQRAQMKGWTGND